MTSDQKPSPRPRPITMELARADDELLDALGRGEPAPEGDEIAELLAAWRAEVAEEPVTVPVRRSAWSGWRVRLVAAAALVTVALGGTSLAAADAGPDSPLWPVTRIVNPDKADTVDAQATLDQARRAIDEGRQADARRLLDQAAKQIATVRDPSAAARLRAELDALRAKLSTVPSSVPSVPSGAGNRAPTVTPSPGTTGGGAAPGGAAPGGGTPGGNNPAPAPTTTNPGSILPTNLPTLPLPTSILPSLPPILK